MLSKLELNKWCRRRAWAFFSNFKWHFGLYLLFIFFPTNLSMKHNHFFVPLLGGKLSMSQLYTVICEQKFVILIGVSHCSSFVFAIDSSWTKAICNNVANQSSHQKKNSVCYISVFSHTLFVRTLCKRKTTLLSFPVFHKTNTHTHKYSLDFG